MYKLLFLSPATQGKLISYFVAFPYLQPVAVISLFLCSMSFLVAQPALVKDINGIETLTELNPQNITQFKGIIYFSGYDATNGQELWRSDGTPQGTYLLKDLTPGVTGSGPSRFINVDGTLYFTANEHISEVSLNTRSGGYQLWKTDGTLAGTVIVNSISFGNWQQGAGFPDAVRLAKAGNTLFYTSGNTPLGYTLKSTKGLSIQIDSYAYSDPNPYFTEANGLLYFSANSVAGMGLLKTDGTTAGTTLIKEFIEDPGKFGAYGPSEITYMNGNLYFAAYDEINERELWKSDGTTASTKIIKNIEEVASSNPSGLQAINGTLYFRAYDYRNRESILWKSDGTENGTVELAPSKNIIDPYGLTDVNGMAFFIATHSWQSTEFELWKTDGTEAGTVLVKKLPSNTNDTWPRNLTNVNGTLYFTVDDGTNGNELWKSNATSTILVKDINPGEENSDPADLTAVNTTLFFRAHDPVNGYQLWKSNSTGTVPILINNTITCTASGSILREVWKNIPGRAVFLIPVNIPPAASSQLTSFESPTNAGDHYGQRLRGYLCAPTSGNYTFYIAGDNNCELWLSSDDDPAEKIKIAYISGEGSYTDVRVWDKYPTQKSAAITLVAGKKYYVEALHKEHIIGDNLAVGWTVPNTNTITVIPGSNLSPYVPAGSGKITKELWSNVPGAIISAIPLNTTPTSVGELTSFEVPSNIANSYGQRLRGYLHPQVSANYTFYIAGDNNCELWLSTDDDPTKKVKIAHISGELAWTPSRIWNKYSTQKSVSIALVAGRKYYVEALHKEKGNGDNLAVAWMRPGQPITIIAGTYLSPFTTNSVARMGQQEGLAQTAQVRLYPNPFDNKLTLQTSQQGKLLISVTDNLGRNVYQATKTPKASELEIDLLKSNLKAGVYFISIQAQDGQTKVVRVLKK